MYGKITEQELHEELLAKIESGGSLVEALFGRTVLVSDTDTVEVNLTDGVFSDSTDILMVFANSVFLQKGEDYTIDGTSIVSASDQWETDDVLDFIVLRRSIAGVGTAELGTMIQMGAMF